jgi:hypothetical protein
VFALFTHCAGMWPPARPSVPPVYEQANCFTPWGNYGVAMSNMAKAHRVAFDAIRTAGLKARVGSAHNVATYEALSVVDEPGRLFTEAMTTFWFQVRRRTSRTRREWAVNKRRRKPGELEHEHKLAATPALRRRPCVAPCARNVSMGPRGPPALVDTRHSMRGRARELSTRLPMEPYQLTFLL